MRLFTCEESEIIVFPICVLCDFFFLMKSCVCVCVRMCAPFTACRKLLSV